MTKTWDKTHTVVHYLGAATLITVIGAIFLVHEAVSSDNAIDSAAVALVGGIVSIATLTIGGLIGMVVGKNMASKIAAAAEPVQPE